MLTTKLEREEAVSGATRPEDLEVCLLRVADSGVFRSAPMMRALLLYLWRRRDDTISEYAVGTEALGRRADFDPRIDASVRVQIARLRARLKEFYETADESFPLLLSIPLGGHHLEWTYQPATQALAPQPDPLSRPGRRGALVALSCVCIGLACLSGFLLLENRALRAVAPAPAPTLSPFWQRFMAGGGPTNIVVTAPTHFSWLEQGLSVRDSNINEYSEWPTSPFLKEMADRWGAPSRSQTRVIARDMIGAVKLLDYLKQRRAEVELLVSSDLPIDHSSDRNTVFVGSPRTAGVLRESLIESNYFFEQTYPTVVRSRRPMPGEPAAFTESMQSPQRHTIPAIVTLLPAAPYGTRSLLLAGRYTTAMASLLASDEGLKLVEERWVQAGRPDGWEMVIQAEIHGETILRAWPVGFSELTPVSDIK